MARQGTIAPGMRVLCRDAEWLVTRVDSADADRQFRAVHCVGADELVRGQQRIFLEQLDRDIEPVDPTKTELVPDASSGYRLSRLFLEAQLRQMPVTDMAPHLERMGTFKPMAYQTEAAHRALLQLRPRLLLADAVGLGKTIEVGMILTELARRGRADRLLVLAKKSMLTQFQSELWNRFGIPLVRLDSEGIARLRLQIPANKNPFEVYHRIIISIDTLKDVGRYRHFLEETRWDVVVIDEAHNVAGANVPERHLSHRLARLLSRRTESLLLTTATPHNGKRETFARLITLLDPSAIPDPRLKEYGPEDIKRFFLMRFKEDIREEAGDSLKDRVVVPLEETNTMASPEEEEVFRVFADTRKTFAQAKAQKREAEPLVQYGLYKQFLSSPESCLDTLLKRLKRLREQDPQGAELAHLERLHEAMLGLSLASSSRYALLLRQLEALSWDGSPKSPRILLFTEYRETQEALANALSETFSLDFSDKFDAQPDQTIGMIHGGVPDIHLMKTVESFGTGKSPIRMLLATDVASEGINLHHECHHVIHYDLPWSIITLIQRNGRVDRFGQTETPYLRYLLVRTEQEGLRGDADIFARLVDKVEEINRATRSGESVLKLYDAAKEEQYIAERGILAGDKEVLDREGDEEDAAEAGELEQVLRQASKEGQSDLLRFLLGKESEEEAVEEEKEKTEERFHLFTNKDFLQQGYRYLAEQFEGYLPLEERSGELLLTAPTDLKKRLGAPDQSHDVIFGGTAIPHEAWPKHGQFLLTDDRGKGELAIRAAQNTEGHWAKVQFLMERHPILQWVAERLVMLMKRGEAPYVRTPHLKPGELCYCFIGQLSSKAGTPIAVDAHAISFLKAGGFQWRSLREALDTAGLDHAVNPGNTEVSPAAARLLPSAVHESLSHMQSAKERNQKEMGPLVREEARRLRRWKSKRSELLQDLMSNLSENHPQRRRWQRELEDMETYVEERRRDWEESYVRLSSDPATRLILVLEGVE